MDNQELRDSEAIWNNKEIEIIVADYLDMLQLELAGVKFNKAERNRILRHRLGRSRGSVEYKHRNISAVMAVLGLPFVWGYKPAANFQIRLIEIIEHRLADSGLPYNVSEGRDDPVLPVTGIDFHMPPDRRQDAKKAEPIFERILGRFEPAARDARARILGEAGEKFLFQAEQNRLSSIGRDDLAAKVRWVSKEDGDGSGYDILSYSKMGEPRWLEVKTTNGPSVTPFRITRNELRVSDEFPKFFRLVRLYNFSWAPAAFKLKSPLSDHVVLDPVQYLATF